MGSPKPKAMFFIFMALTVTSLPPTQSCAPCKQPPHHHHPPHHGGGSKGHGGHHHPPHHGGGSKGHKHPPIVLPPIILPPPPVIVSPPPVIVNPPPVIYPPPSPVIMPPPHKKMCPIDALKLGLCADVLGGLVHVGLGNPVENTCCPVLEGLLDLEAALCLCTVLRLKLLNINLFLPLALQALITCGKNPPPPGFVCPPLP